MPKPQEICVVIANGQRYDIWETVEVISSVDGIVDHAMLTVAEPSDNAKNFSSLKLKPGDQASVTLAGQTVIDGIVYLRQGVVTAAQHMVQIGICSHAQSVVTSTVRNQPGQYKNQTLEQMVSKVFGEVGVPFKIAGAPAGAEKSFDRVSEHVGETRYQFAETLARMRNLHMVDDGQNGVMAFRGAFGRASSRVVEGYNLLQGRILLKNNESLDRIRVVGQRANQDSAGANSQSEAETAVPTTVHRDGTIACEEMADDMDCMLRANHEADWVAYQEVDGEVTVQGWLNGEGVLWWNDRLKEIVVEAPTLLPGDGRISLIIKSVIHRQSNAEGTTTTLQLCLPQGLGGNGPIYFDPSGKQ